MDNADLIRMYPSLKHTAGGIWLPLFLHARHVSSVDAAKDCFTGILESGLVLVRVQHEKHSEDDLLGDLGM